MSTILSGLSRLALGSPLGRVRRGLGRVVGLVFAWQARAAQRTHLSRLDDRLLRDMGLTRADVEGERSKPFWKA